MSVYAVQYTYADNAEGLDAHRASHRDFLRGLGREGVVLLSGPMAAGVGQPDAALLLVQADGPDEILRRLADDPFQEEGLVENVEIRGWNPVLGAWFDGLADRL
ncbi:MAG: YciI family protein [Actinomycetes bacterium]